MYLVRIRCAVQCQFQICYDNHEADSFNWKIFFTVKMKSFPLAHYEMKLDLRLETNALSWGLYPP